MTLEQQRQSAAEKLISLRAWIRRQEDRQRNGRRGPVLANEIIAYIKKRWPRTKPHTIDWLYRVS